MTQLRKTLTATFAVAATVSLVACGQSTDHAPVTTSSPAGTSTAPPAGAAADRNNALVRFVHAVPTGVAMDVYADEARAFEGVAYKTVTPYEEVPGERSTIALRAAGVEQGDAIATNREGLDDGDHYTVIAVPGDDDRPMLRVVEDDLTHPADGKARVRVVHAARGVDEVDVVAGEKTFDGVNFQSVARYDEVDAWAGSLQVKAEGNTAPLTTVPNVRFDAGKVYTVVVVGSANAPEAIVIEDQVDLATASR